jgi:hypothetical protein
MPIRVLEQINGKQFLSRKKALAAGGLNFCFLLSVLGLFIEAMLLLGEILFVMLIARQFYPPVLDYMQENKKTTEIFIFAAFCLNYILVESLYVCMGFGLYINSRVELEGWDLQLLFQKFAGVDAPASHTGASSKVSATNIKALLLLCFFLVGLFIPMAPAAAEDAVEYLPENFPFASAESLKKLEEILASEDFGGEKEGWEIRLKPREGRETQTTDLAPWIKKIGYTFSFILRFFVILTSIGFLVFALYRLWKFRRNLFQWKSWVRRKRHTWNSLQINSFRNSLTSSESPESLFAMAEDFFCRDLPLEAWAACLAGYIGSFARYRSLSFPIDATEYDCLKLVRSALPEEDEGFGEFVRNWISFAYGGRIPVPGTFERVLAYGRSLAKDFFD